MRIPHRAFAATLLVAVMMGNAALSAAESTFDFKDPKGVNAVSFLLDSPLEPIAGLASGVAGKITFDPKKPKQTAGTLVVQAATLHTQNDGMTDVLRSEDWLDVEKYPQITFTIKKIKKAAGKTDGLFKMKLIGDFTCKGVTKELPVDITATYLPGALAKRMGGKEGDLLVLRSEFKINRKDFGIKPEYGPEVVAEEIQLRVAIVGMHPKATE